MPIRDLEITGELPPGTRLLIVRLLQYDEAAGGLEVEAEIMNSTNSERTVFLDAALLSNPRRLPQTNFIWAGNPDMLENTFEKWVFN